MNSTSAEAVSTQATSPCAAGPSAAKAGSGNSPPKAAAKRNAPRLARQSILVIMFAQPMCNRERPGF